MKKHSKQSKIAEALIILDDAAITYLTKQKFKMSIIENYYSFKNAVLTNDLKKAEPLFHLAGNSARDIICRTKLLLSAVKANYLEMVKLISQYDVYLTLKKYSYSTLMLENLKNPMLVASSNQRWDAVIVMAESKSGKYASYESDLLSYVLHHAVQDNNLTVAKKILRLNTKVYFNNLSTSKPLTNYRKDDTLEDEMENILHIAIKNNNAKMLKLLLKYRVNHFYTNEQGLAPITYAASRQQWNMVNLLASAYSHCGGNYNYKLSDPYPSVFQMAISAGKLATVETFLKAKIPYWKTCSQIPLDQNRPKMLALLLAFGAKQPYTGKLPVKQACLEKAAHILRSSGTQIVQDEIMKPYVFVQFVNQKIIPDFNFDLTNKILNSIPNIFGDLALYNQQVYQIKTKLFLKKCQKSLFFQPRSMRLETLLSELKTISSNAPAELKIKLINEKVSAFCAQAKWNDMKAIQLIKKYHLIENSFQDKKKSHR